MPTVSVSRRARPFRFAFLVAHNNVADIRRAIETSTVLWGGMFNAIVPVLGRLSGRWDTLRTSNEIVRGYLDAFEPDFVVTGEGIDGSRFGAEPSRSFPLASMATREGLSSRGMTAMPIYRWRHEQEFRFVQREAVPLRIPVGTLPGHALWVAAALGAFPGGELAPLEKAYRSLGAQEAALTPETYFEQLLFSFSPLNLANFDLERLSHSRHERTYMLIDHRDPLDVIDFWNLRAIGWDIVAIPVVWAPTLAARIAASASRQQVHQLKGRSLSASAFEEFARSIEAPGRVVEQEWYPQVWEPSARESQHVRRCELSAARDDQEALVHDGRITFTSVAPTFAQRSVFDPPRFMNVVRLRSFDMPELATTLPRELTDLSKLLKEWGFPIGNTSEGITIRTDVDEKLTIRAPLSLRVFEERFSLLGSFELSAAGRVANRMIQLLGGPEQIRLVANLELVRMLEGTSATASHDIPHAEIFGRLMRQFGNRPERVERHLAAMIARNVFRVGLRLQCQQCSQQNWFALTELREQMRCHSCLDELPFPSAMPPKQPCWSYRPLGPFGVKGQAHGSYVVTAAIRLLRELNSQSETAWVPSFTLTTADGKLEADFGVYWKLHGDHFPPQLLIGECKTFNRFEAIDLARMRRLARLIPGAVLVFATLNETLSPTERRLITTLAEWGRRREWQHPVMILTARELTSDEQLPRCWREGSAREQAMFEKVARSPWPATSVRRLADATQQLHLGMSADANWPHYQAP